MIARTAPRCPDCGKEYRGVYEKHGRHFVGDTFVRWDIEGHRCPALSNEDMKAFGSRYLKIWDGPVSSLKQLTMGNFRIVIDAVGGHGVDRKKKDGEVVDFNAEGEFSPDAIALRFTNELKRFGVSINTATIIHWPGDPTEVQDNLLTGKRKGNF